MGVATTCSIRIGIHAQNQMEYPFALSEALAYKFGFRGGGRETLKSRKRPGAFDEAEIRNSQRVDVHPYEQAAVGRARVTLKVDPDHVAPILEPFPAVSGNVTRTEHLPGFCSGQQLPHLPE